MDPMDIAPDVWGNEDAVCCAKCLIAKLPPLGLAVKSLIEPRERPLRVDDASIGMLCLTQSVCADSKRTSIRLTVSPYVWRVDRPFEKVSYSHPSDIEKQDGHCGSLRVVYLESAFRIVREAWTRHTCGAQLE